VNWKNSFPWTNRRIRRFNTAGIRGFLPAKQHENSEKRTNIAVIRRDQRRHGLQSKKAVEKICFPEKRSQRIAANRGGIRFEEDFRVAVRCVGATGCEFSFWKTEKSFEEVLTRVRKAIELRVSIAPAASAVSETEKNTLLFDNLVVTTSILILQPVVDW
jgi:hypothetical protein